MFQLESTKHLTANMIHGKNESHTKGVDSKWNYLLLKVSVYGMT